MKQATYTNLQECTRDVIIAVYEGEALTASLADQLGDQIEAILDRSFSRVTTVYPLDKFPFARIHFLGMGKRNQMTSARMRQVFAQVPRHAQAPMSFMAGTAVCEAIDIHKVAELFAETYELTAYQEKRAKRPVYDVDIIAAEAINADIERGAVYAQGINHARKWADTPANIMTPKRLGEEAKALAQRYSLDCNILTRSDLERLQAGGILAVAQGSDQEPCLIEVTYRGGAENDPYTVFVGKGLTFDAGGYNIKSDSYDMKYDMCGGADVLGALEIIAANHAPHNVVALIPACENLISGSACKPGDVITTMAGKTVEVVNTDAEGRLILCDALTYAQTHYTKIKQIVDIATLTGACARALGDVYAGVFANDEAFYAEFAAALQISDERGWRLPLAKEYHEVLTTDCADLKNSAKGSAGASVAACFLEEFIRADIPWIHLDIAGVANAPKQGASGAMVRTLANLCR